MQKQNKKIDKYLLAFFLGLGSLIAACAPSFMNAVSEITQGVRIGSYNNAAAGYNDEEIAKMWEDAVKYNKQIFHAQQESLFQYQGDNATDDTYESLLNCDGEGTICYLEIPKINVDLPVGHGTNSRLLEHSAGHMYGTSIPVGGKNENAVIAGHTGLSNAKIFTDLIKMKKGDTFRLHILGEIHIYKIKAIETVLPDDETPYLQVVPDEDMVTLYTCTPVGVNDHRLILRGVRCGTEKESSAELGQSVRTRNLNALLHALLFGGIPIAYGLTGMMVSRKKKKKLAKLANVSAPDAETVQTGSDKKASDKAANQTAQTSDGRTETHDEPPLDGS